MSTHLPVLGMAQAASELGETFDRDASVQPGERRGHRCPPGLGEPALEAFLVSTGVVALAEMGDKTQLLSLLLAARYRRPWPIILGILIATTVNHACASAVGEWLTGALGREVLAWVLGLSFIAMAIWILIPDKIELRHDRTERFGVLGATIIAFFLAEMGDKTQIATVALAAKYTAFVAVVAGTTFGMMLANAPVVLLGDRLAERIPLRLTRAIAGGIFVVLGVLMILNGGSVDG